MFDRTILEIRISYLELLLAAEKRLALSLEFYDKFCKMPYEGRWDKVIDLELKITNLKNSIRE